MLIKGTIKKALLCTLTFFALGCNALFGQGRSFFDIAHVVVIGFDGLSPDGLQNAETPVFDKLIKEGTYSMHARAVLPTSSSPNWASMIMGAGPEQHGITSNAWERNNFTLPAVAQGDDFLFPTIFRLVNEQREDVEIGVIYDWGGFGRLFEKGAVDYDINAENEDETAELASKYIIGKKPDLTFVHFDHVDHAGHEFGHGTNEYYRSVEKADKLLGNVMKAIEEAGITDDTLIIVSADHGGMGKGHGGESLQEVEIPFIVWGKGVKNNYKIAHPVYQYDNAATVAFAMGLETPRAWIGKPVKSAFKGFEVKDAYPVLEQLKEPIIFPRPEGYRTAGGLFYESAYIVIENPNSEGTVRYTLDGSIPSKGSKSYQDSIQIKKNTILKSAVFKNGKINSPVAEAFFRIRPSSLQKPVAYDLFYLEDLSFIPELGKRKPDLTGSTFEITSDEIKDMIKANTAVRFTAQIEIDRADTYTFYTRSDDGSKLFVGGNVIVDNDGDHGVREKQGKIDLTPGEHNLEVLWFNGGGDGWLDVYVESGTMPKQLLSTTLLRGK